MISESLNLPYNIIIMISDIYGEKYIYITQRKFGKIKKYKNNLLHYIYNDEWSLINNYYNNYHFKRQINYIIKKDFYICKYICKLERI